MNLSVITLLASLFSLTSQAADLSPIETVLAADQSQVTAESLRYEQDEFTAMLRWQTTYDLWEMAKTRAELKKRDAVRADRLLKAQVITVENQIIVGFIAQMAANDVVRLEAEMDHARAQAAVARLNVLHWGNPGSVSVLELAKIQLAEREALLRALQFCVGVLETEVHLTDLKLQGGVELRKRNVIGESDMDTRTFNLKNAEQRLQAARSQLIVTQKGIEASKKTIAALSRR